MNNICPKYWHTYFTFTNETAEKLNLYIPKPNVEIVRKTLHHLLKNLNPDI